MRRIDQWLLPILTCLVVLAALLLPQRISRWRDEAALDGPHTEELKTENDLPTQSLTLEERILLLAQYNDAPDSMTAIVQELELSGEVEELMHAELEQLCAGGILDSEAIPESFAPFWGHRIYLRAPDKIWGASFLTMEGYLKEDGTSLSLVLDEASGIALRLEVFTPAIQKWVGEPVDVGLFFLDRMGVASTCTGYGMYDAAFDLPGADCHYEICRANALTVIPYTGYTSYGYGEVTDSNAAAAAGMAGK